MDYVSLIGIAVGLSMDAFAVSITSGATIRTVTPRFAIKISLSFGAFQAIMPVLGWLVGKAGESFINSVDHWVALILLSYLGIKMIIESKKKNSCETAVQKQDDLSFKTLMTLSIATSIDALATGIILPSAVGASTITLMLLSVGINNLYILYHGRLPWQKLWQTLFPNSRYSRWSSAHCHRH